MCNRVLCYLSCDLHLCSRQSAGAAYRRYIKIFFQCRCLLSIGYLYTAKNEQKKKSYTKKKHNEGGNLNEFTESQAQNPRPELGADVEPISHINLRVHGGFSFRLQLEKLEIWPGGPRGDTLFQPFFFLVCPC